MIRVFIVAVAARDAVVGTEGKAENVIYTAGEKADDFTARAKEKRENLSREPD